VCVCAYVRACARVCNFIYVWPSDLICARMYVSTFECIYLCMHICIRRLSYMFLYFPFIKIFLSSKEPIAHIFNKLLIVVSNESNCHASINPTYSASICFCD